MNPIVTLVLALVIALASPALLFVSGMRRKSPRVLDAIRRFNRAVTNPRVSRTAGTTGSGTALIRHAGRSTNRSHETPVGAIATPTGFLVALPYGLRADWVKNVLASGTATIVDSGNTYNLIDPVIVETRDVQALLPVSERRMLRLFKVEQCLRLSLRDGDTVDPSWGDERDHRTESGPFTLKPRN